MLGTRVVEKLLLKIGTGLTGISFLSVVAVFGIFGMGPCGTGSEAGDGILLLGMLGVIAGLLIVLFTDVYHFLTWSSRVVHGRSAVRLSPPR